MIYEYDMFMKIMNNYLIAESALQYRDTNNLVANYKCPLDLMIIIYYLYKINCSTVVQLMP